jgi:hypothetical protein
LAVLSGIFSFLIISSVVAMKNMKRVVVALAICALCSGCQSWASNRHDQAIAKFADQSGFPSASDVGFVDAEAEPATTGGTMLR